jgi:gliding motility-associated-like protein
MKAKTKIALLALALFFSTASKAQLIFITTPDTTICSGPITLNAQSVQGQLTSITIDDGYSPVFPIGFTFNFFGNNYTQLVLGGNGIISFNLAYASGFCPWAINQAIPSAAVPINSIMCPWQDLYPPSGGTLRYGTVGTAPNRKFVYEFCSMPYYYPTTSCPGINFTGQVILYETTNIIEIHILNKPAPCMNWNGGKATEGIQNATGTIAFSIAGRNNQAWGPVNNDSYRWTPTGPNTYNVTNIPYSPIPVVTSVTWFANSVQVGTGNSLTVNPTTTTSYIAVGAIAGGCNAIQTYRDTVTVTVVPGYTVNLNVTNVLCNGDATGSITANPTGGGQPPFHYLWSTSANDTLQTLSNLTIGTYTVTVTDSVGCRSSASATIIEPPPLVVIPDSIAVLCAGQLTGSASVIVNGGTPGYTYLWSDGSSNSSVTNVAGGVYTCTITDANGCSQVVSINVLEPPALTINPTQSQPICIGTAVNLAANAAGGVPPYTYAWSDGSTTPNINVSPVVTTIYTVIVTDANGCTITSPSIIITVSSPLNVSLTASALSICSGTGITLSAVGSGGDGNYTYTWTPGIGSGPGPHSDTPSQTTTYTVTLTDGCGTPSSASQVNVVVNPMPVVNFTGVNLSGCVPFNACFTDLSNVASGSITVWDWDFGDNSSHGTTQNPCHTYLTPSAPNQYTVTLTATTNAGCSGTFSMTNVDAYPVTVAAFSASPKITTIADPAITFYDNSNGATSWTWTFGDGNTDNSQNPLHVYAAVGAYEVCLITTNQYLCSDTICDSVIVRPDFSFYVPNAFTPNGDGINEVFTPMGRSFKNYDLTIYDRWGQVIFRSKNISFSWDGKMSNGEDAQNGVYVYTIELSDMSDLKHRFIGNVAVIR